MTLDSRQPAETETATATATAESGDLKITKSTDLESKSARRLKHSVTLINWQQRLPMLNHLPLFLETVICVHWNDGGRTVTLSQVNCPP